MTKRAPLPRRGPCRNLDGPELRRRRVLNGLTQAQLAAAVGTSRGQVSHWENGDWGCQPAQLPALAAAVGCEPADLLPRAAGSEHAA
jgi:transcriptional regulator with XRE-family HTH domain